MKIRVFDGMNIDLTLAIYDDVKKVTSDTIFFNNGKVEDLHFNELWEEINVKALNEKTRSYRKGLPAYNNNRRVVVTNYATKHGMDIIKSFDRFAGDTLDDCYTTYSQDKERAFDEVWQMYINDKWSTDFHITSKNTYGFSVAWISENVLIYITSNTEYHVVLAG